MPPKRKRNISHKNTKSNFKKKNKIQKKILKNLNVIQNQKYIELINSKETNTNNNNKILDEE